MCFWAYNAFQWKGWALENKMGKDTPLNLTRLGCRLLSFPGNRVYDKMSETWNEKDEMEQLEKETRKATTSRWSWQLRGEKQSKLVTWHLVWEGTFPPECHRLATLFSGLSHSQPKTSLFTILYHTTGTTSFCLPSSSPLILLYGKVIINFLSFPSHSNEEIPLPFLFFSSMFFVPFLSW